MNVSARQGEVSEGSAERTMVASGGTDTGSPSRCPPPMLMDIVSRVAQPQGAELRATPSQRLCLVSISMMIVMTVVRLAGITNYAVDGQASEMPGRRSLIRKSQGHVRIRDLGASGDADLQRG